MKLLDVPWHGLLNTQCREFTQDEAKMFMMMCFMEAENNNEAKVKAMDEEFRKLSFAYAVMQKRLEAYGVWTHVSTPLAVFLGGICDSPADAVMWAYTLNYLYVATGEPVTTSTWAESFPRGVPTDSERHRVWDAQKCGVITPGCENPGSNWVDNFDNWPKVN